MATMSGGVARQELFDQRRAGARQADDKDRVGGVEAGVRAAGEEVARKQRLRTPQVVARLLGVVDRGFATQLIAQAIVLEGRRVIVLIFQRLAEREVEMIAILFAEI
jgi:hypothetical protein